MKPTVINTIIQNIHEKFRGIGIIFDGSNYWEIHTSLTITGTAASAALVALINGGRQVWQQHGKIFQLSEEVALF